MPSWGSAPGPSSPYRCHPPRRGLGPGLVIVSRFQVFPWGSAPLSVFGMPEYLVEVYLPRAAPAAGLPAGHASRAPDDITWEGKRATLTGCVYVPEEEICFYLVQAASGDDVRTAATVLGLVPERVVEVVLDWPTPQLEIDLRDGCRVAVVEPRRPAALARAKLPNQTKPPGYRHPARRGGGRPPEAGPTVNLSGP
jgi:hypothetical protein